MMERKQSFRDNIINGYSCKGEIIVLEGACTLYRA
jgi:hypothetical protein